MLVMKKWPTWLQQLVKERNLKDDLTAGKVATRLAQGKGAVATRCSSCKASAEALRGGSIFEAPTFRMHLPDVLLNSLTPLPTQHTVIFQYAAVLRLGCRATPILAHLQAKFRTIGQNSMLDDRQRSEDCLWSPAPRQLHPLGRDLTYRDGDSLLTMLLSSSNYSSNNTLTA